MDGSEITCNTAALANQAVHDIGARIRLVEHLYGPRRDKLISYATNFLKDYPRVSADPEDILSGVLGALWQKYSTGRFQARKDNSSFYGLLKTITKRKVHAQFRYDHAGKRKVSMERPCEGDECLVQGDDHVDMVACQDLVAQCFQDIESCPKIDESVRAQLRDIMLFTLEDTRSRKEISALMAISVSKVRRLQSLLESILDHRREDARD